jgi:hypothetical protein
VLSKAQLLDSISGEIRIVRHLARKVPPRALDWRPSPSQRSTIELLRYLSTAGIDLARALLSGTWDPAAVTGQAPTTLRFEDFDPAMARQEADLRAALGPLTERDLAERRATLPTGETTNLGAALVAVVLKALVAYRMQLFLHAKASGNDALTTADCWFGVDSPPSARAPASPRPRRIERPAPSEYDPSYEPYLADVPGDDALEVLGSQREEARPLFATLSEERALDRYAPGKWSVKEVLGHLCDSERVFAYRALRFGRGDPTPLPNFDEGLYVRTGRFDGRPVASLLGEFLTLRAGTLSLFESFDDEALGRSGVARDCRFTARALAWVTAGHAAHHFAVLRDRYGLR